VTVNDSVDCAFTAFDCALTVHHSETVLLQHLLCFYSILTVQTKDDSSFTAFWLCFYCAFTALTVHLQHVLYFFIYLVFGLLWPTLFDHLYLRLFVPSKVYIIRAHVPQEYRNQFTPHKFKSVLVSISQVKSSLSLSLIIIALLSSSSYIPTSTSITHPRVLTTHTSIIL
jgi:hypothetical protein